jgi:hypothetical protein
MSYINLGDPTLPKECRTTHHELCGKQVPISEITTIIRRYVKACNIPFEDVKRNESIRILFATSILLSRLKTMLLNMSSAVQELERILLENPKILEALMNNKGDNK